MAFQIIPVTSNPNQSFNVSLNVNGAVLRLSLAISYNEMANYWEMTVTDVNGNELITNIPFVTGVWPAANILAQYGYLQIGAAYIINLASANDYPSANDLGTDFILLWGDNV